MLQVTTLIRYKIQAITSVAGILIRLINVSDQRYTPVKNVEYIHTSKLPHVKKLMDYKFNAKVLSLTILVAFNLLILYVWAYYETAKTSQLQRKNS